MCSSEDTKLTKECNFLNGCIGSHHAKQKSSNTYAILHETRVFARLTSRP